MNCVVSYTHGQQGSITHRFRGHKGANVEEQPVIIMREGEFSGQQWTITAPEFLIGRGGDCDLVLPERQVSRHHLKILRQPGQFALQDLDSKNGTHLNGQPVTGTVPLQDGDEIQIALAVKLVFIGTGATMPLTFDPPKPEQTAGNRRSRALRHRRRTNAWTRPSLSPSFACCNCSTKRMARFAAAMLSSILFGPEQKAWAYPSRLSMPWCAVSAIASSNSTNFNFVVTVRGHGFRLDNPKTAELQR